MPRKEIIKRRYLSDGCFVEARVAIINVVNQRRTSIISRFKLDTGFSGGVHVPHFHVNDARIVDVEPRSVTIRIAGGQRDQAYACYGSVEKVNDHTISGSGIETEIIFHGSDTYGLIGLLVMKEWIVEFDGPKSVATVYEEVGDQNKN